MVISCLYVQTVTRQCFCFPNSQWGVTAHDIWMPWYCGLTAAEVYKGYNIMLQLSTMFHF